LYSIAFTAFRNSWQLFALLALVITVIEGLELLSSTNTAGIILTIFVAFYSHRMVLLGEAYDWKSKTSPEPMTKGARFPIWPFMWRSAVLFAVFLIAFIFLLAQLTNVSGPLEPDSLEFLSRILVCLVVILPFYGILLALIGTILPAAATEQNASLKSALRRGLKTFWRTLGRLIFGNMLFSATLLIVSVLLVTLLQSSGLGAGLPMHGLTFLINLGSYFSVMLAATALSMAYQEGEERLAQ
jgi:hypothetical protein